MHALAAPQQRHRHHRCAGPRALAGAGAEIDYLANEFVPEHDLLVRAHGAVVAGFGRYVGEFVAVMAGVQVGAADAAAQDVDQQLALGRGRCR